MPLMNFSVASSWRRTQPNYQNYQIKLRISSYLMSTSIVRIFWSFYRAWNQTTRQDQTWYILSCLRNVLMNLHILSFACLENLWMKVLFQKTEKVAMWLQSTRFQNECWQLSSCESHVSDMQSDGQTAEKAVTGPPVWYWLHLRLSARFCPWQILYDSITGSFGQMDRYTW